MTLLVVAHGSRDPRHGATVTALTARVRSLAPGLTVATGFLDFTRPDVEEALTRLYADGERDVVAVPLLLRRAYHARADVPAVLSCVLRGLPGLAVRQADVLGPDPLLYDALDRRLAEAGAGADAAQRAETGVVLASAGSSDPGTPAAFARLAEEWRRASGWAAVLPAYAATPRPTAAQAVRELRAAGVRRVALAPYMIAPGRLSDRVMAGAREAGADVTAPVLGAAPELARIVLDRYRTVRATERVQLKFTPA
ncbi:sirohydrochlorin chelatase [Streptomyces avicenniae]|uniref:sirohydrochlorin chelatase n=1 Tax=Streptomyces avicenniae TaxID=500153 RepID=UPI00069ACBBE|nr:sirohydrochlorin chelatase [Streptomyces avicenniae]